MLKLRYHSKFFGATAVYFCILIGFITIRLVSAYGLLDFLGDAGNYILNIVLQVGLMFLLPLFLYSAIIKEKPKNTLKNFGIKKIKWSAVGIAVLIGIIVFILNIGVSSFFAMILSLLGFEKLPTVSDNTYTIQMLIINLIFTAVLPAICEEITHRGMLVDGLSKLGYKKAIIISALLFGLTHLNIEQFFYATIIGFLLAFITMISGNIIPAMIVHFMNNALNVLVSFLLINSTRFANFYNMVTNAITQNSFFVVITALFLGIAVLVALLLYFIYLLFKETAISEITSLAEEETKRQLRENLMSDSTQKPQTINSPFQIFHGSKAINIYISSSSLRHPVKQIYYPTLREKAFLISSLTTAIFITVSTFIWGLL